MMNLNVATDEFQESTGSVSLPSVQEIQTKGQKPNWRTQGNVLARYWARPSAVYGTWLALRLGISANAITLLAALAWLLESLFIATGHINLFQIGVVFGFLGFWLDHVDGQLARLTGSESVDGIFLDFCMHTAHGLTRACALGFGLYKATGHEMYIICGMAMAWGWTMLSIANDAKYKAFLAELKKTGKKYAAQNPMDSAVPETSNHQYISFRRMISWPLAKCQEAHVVLFTQTAIGLLFINRPAWGWLVWKLAVLFWAISAPVLAVARVGRVVRGRKVGQEFHEWFREA